MRRGGESEMRARGGGPAAIPGDGPTTPRGSAAPEPGRRTAVRSVELMELRVCQVRRGRTPVRAEGVTGAAGGTGRGIAAMPDARRL